MLNFTLLLLLFLLLFLLLLRIQSFYDGVITSFSKVVDWLRWLHGSAVGRYDLAMECLHDNVLNLGIQTTEVKASHYFYDVKNQPCTFIKRFIFTWAIMLLFGCFLFTWNPFNLSEKSDELSQDVISKMMTPFFSDIKHAEKIVLLIINDQAIDYVSGPKISSKLITSNSWPIKYKEHANVLDAISLASKPKQVFIDFEFKRIRNTDPTFPILETSIRRLNDMGVHVMHALGSPGQMISTDVNERFIKSGSIPVFNGKPEESGQYLPLIQKNKKYGEDVLSPALQMYKNINSEELDNANYKESMFIQWSVNCKGSDFSADGYFSQVMGVIGRNLTGESGQYPVSCIPAQIISVNTLQKIWSSYKSKYSGTDKASKEEAIKSSKEANKKLTEIFDGATVIYAADYIALSDLVYSPNYGTIPGAFVHIAALNNLLNYEEDYFKKLDDDVLDWFLFILSIIVSLLFVVLEMHKKGMFWNAVFLIMVTILSLFFISLQSGLVKAAPINFISILFVFTLYWLIRKFFIYLEIKFKKVEVKKQ